MRRASLVAAVLWSLAGCQPPAPVATAPSGPPSCIVATEQAPAGGLLVFVGPDGSRLADLTTAPPALGDDDEGLESAPEGARGRVIDRQPAWSPDGAWVAFASSRRRGDPALSSLWLVAPEPGARPIRLTDGDAIDSDPAWVPGTSSLVFASNRGGTFGLWRIDVASAGVAGPAVRVTDTPEHDLAPTISPDGRNVAFERLDTATGERSIWRVPLEGGQARRLTRGPDDRAPAWSPQGDRIVFSAATRADRDLVAVRPDGGGRATLIDDRVGDQLGPAFSADGALLLASSVVRARASAAPIFSSLVVVDESGDPPVLRALDDPVVVPRIGRAAVGQCEAGQGASTASLPVYSQAVVLEALRDLCRDRAGADEQPGGCSELAP